MRRNGNKQWRWYWKPKKHPVRKPISDLDQAALLQVVLKNSDEYRRKAKANDDELLSIALEDSARKANERQQLLRERATILRQQKALTKRLKELKKLI